MTYILTIFTFIILKAVYTIYNILMQKATMIPFPIHYKNFRPKNTILDGIKSIQFEHMETCSNEMKQSKNYNKVQKNSNPIKKFLLIFLIRLLF